MKKQIMCVLIILLAVTAVNAESIDLGIYESKNDALRNSALNYISVNQEAINLGEYLDRNNDSMKNDLLMTAAAPTKENFNFSRWSGLTEAGTIR